MTKEALRIALDALKEITRRNQSDHQAEIAEEAITAIKAALKAKDEPVKLRRGDILRCAETDKLCTVWATSTTGKTLVKWGADDFGNYSAEQIGELFWLEPPQPEPVAWIWEKEDGYTSIETHSLDDEDMKNVGVKSMKSLYAKPQFIGLSEDEILLISADCAATHQHDDIHFAKAIESKLKDKNI